MEHGGGHGHSARTFRDDLLLFHQRQDGGGDLVLCDGHDAVHVLADHLEGGVAGVLDGNAIGEGLHGGERHLLAQLNGLLHGGGVLGLYAVNLDVGIQALDRVRHAGDQSAAANRAQHHVHVLQLVEDLQADGSLSGDDLVVVKGVDERHAGFVPELQGVSVGVVVGALDQHDLRAQCLGGLDLRNGRTLRHADDRLGAHAGGRQCDALGVIARRAGYDAGIPLLLTQLADFVIRAAQLEGAGVLEVFGLEVESVIVRELGGFDQIRLAGDGLENECGVVDFIERDHGDGLLGVTF